MAPNRPGYKHPMAAHLMTEARPAAGRSLFAALPRSTTTPYCCARAPPEVPARPAPTTNSRRRTPMRRTAAPCPATPFPPVEAPVDVIEHLTQEHRKAEQLMDQLQGTDPGTRRDQLVAELTDALTTHMAVEERYLYPIVTEVLGAETETEAETEHGLARDGLAKLDELRAAPGFGAALDMVKAGIAHHVHEEEHEVFPQLRQKAPDRVAALDPD